jgi:hypothetical protein
VVELAYALTGDARLLRFITASLAARAGEQAQSETRSRFHNEIM